LEGIDLMSPISQRRKSAFTKTELKTYNAAAQEAGLETWAVERTDKDGVTTRFISGATVDGQSEWDRHEGR
jgi:hypothetical protein